MVVQVCIVRLDAVQEQVTCLLKERVDGKIQSVQRRVGRDLDRSTLNVGQRRGERDIGVGRRHGKLVQEGSEEMGVVDVDGKLEKDVLVGQLRLLQAVGSEFALLVGGHEDAGEFEGAEAQGALRRSADIMNQRDDIVVFTLIVILILNEAKIDKVAHGGAGVPADVVGVDIDFFEMPDHLALVVNVGLGTRGCGSQARSIILMSVGTCDVDSRERESIGDFNDAVDVHAHEGAGRGGREGRGAVLGDLHHHLWERGVRSASCPAGRTRACLLKISYDRPRRLTKVSGRR